MGDAAPIGRQFGEGPLARVAALIYSLLVTEALLLVTTVPTLVPLLLLDRDVSNLPLVALCLLPLGPAVSAALYGLHQHRPDLADLKPVVLFWRGYRANLRGVLAIWIPWLVWLTVLGVNLANLRAADVPDWWGALLVLIALGATLWGANALVITSLFAFRVRDVARLALYFMVRTWGVALGNAGLLVVAASIVWLSSEAVLALLGSVLILLLLRTSRPMIDRIAKEFTA